MATPDQPPDNLRELQHKIDDARAHLGNQKQGDNSAHVNKGLAQAMHLAGGIVIGSSIGGALGYYADRWLDSSPLGLFVGFLIGFAAGVYRLMREFGKSEK